MWEAIRIAIRNAVNNLEITPGTIAVAALFEVHAPEIWRKYSWLRALGGSNPYTLNDEWREWLKNEMLDDEPWS